MQTLRPYQAEALERLRASMRSGHKRIVLVAPTGSGKTTIAAAAIDSAVNRGRRVLFLAHRDELIAQCSQRLAEHGLPHGIIKAGYGGGDLWPVQVASVQTLVRRSGPPSNLLVVDECHRTLAETYLKILDRYPEATVIGLSATPYRTDNRGLGDVYTDLVEVATPSQLIELGFLLRPRIFAPSTPDLAGIRRVAGDFNQRELTLRCDVPVLIGSIVEHWGHLARGRRSVLFAASIEHSRHLVAALRGAGARAAHLDAETPLDERAAILRLLRDGELDVVSNVAILTEGWDLPALSACIMARPTQSTGLFLQMAGRVMRPFDGKADAIILDHAGNCHRHGFPDEDRVHSLEATPSRTTASGEALVKTCPRCFLVYPLGLGQCPDCGYEPPGGGAREMAPRAVDGELVELEVKPIRLATNPSTRARQEDYLRWRAEAWANGWKPGYAKVKYLEKYKVWPVKLITEVWDDEQVEAIARRYGIRPRRVRVGG